MAQNHNADYSEKPMTTYGRTQGPSRRYRRLRHPTFPAAEWTAKNPLLQRGEIGFEIDTHKAKVGDGTTYWNSLPYAMVAETEWGHIVGNINDQTDLKNALDDKVDKTTTASQVYGTDQNGNQTTYNTTDLSAVDDVKVNNVSVVTNRVADIDLTSYLQNTATATDALTLLGTANTSWVNGINIGKDSRINSNNGVAIGVEASADVNAVGIGRDADAGVRGTAIGAYAKTSYDTGIAIGCWNSVMHNAVSSAKGAYQFGVGTNSTARTLNVGWYNDSVTPSTFVNYKLLDGDTGLIPDARISTNIARTADIPTVNDATLTIQKNGTTVDTFTANAASNVTMNITVPTTPADIGAQSEITASNKLNADLVDDSTSTNKFVTASDITTWNGKQDTLTAGTNITITGTTISATDTTYSDFTGATAGDAGTNGLVPAPAAGDQGKFLQGDGTWATVDALPAQTGHSGEYLTTDGSTASWATVNTLPSQTGQSGKFLTTDGTDASWSDKPLVNAATGYRTIAIGSSGIIGSIYSTSLGTNTDPAGNFSVSLGDSSMSYGGGTIAIGYAAKTSAAGAIQLNTSVTTITNSDADTFKVANRNGNFEIMSADGTIPEARLADTTGASQGDVLTLDSNGDAVWQAAGGSVSIDNSTITKNGSDELQAVATVNANTAVGATNPVYDWVGTLAEYTAQDIENQHPNWMCYITDDVNGGTSVYTKTEVDNNFVGKGHEVIAFQAPNAGNNYTWYRKYRDGWVEQGGMSAGALSGNIFSQTLVVPMATAGYNVSLLPVLNSSDTGNYYCRAIESTTTQIRYYVYLSGNVTTYNPKVFWMACGMAA